jgi:hypothetical protein
MAGIIHPQKRARCAGNALSLAPGTRSADAFLSYLGVPDRRYFLERLFVNVRRVLRQPNRSARSDYDLWRTFAFPGRGKHRFGQSRLCDGPELVRHPDELR